MATHPQLLQTVLDATDARQLAEFWRGLLGLTYRPGSEPPTELETQRERALALGATVLLDRTDDPDEPPYVLADPAGHPFCLFVA